MTLLTAEISVARLWCVTQLADKNTGTIKLELKLAPPSEDLPGESRNSRWSSGLIRAPSATNLLI